MFSVLDYLAQHQVIEPQPVPYHPAADLMKHGWVWYGTEVVPIFPVVPAMTVQLFDNDTLNRWQTRVFPPILHNGLCFLLPLAAVEELRARLTEIATRAQTD